MASFLFLQHSVDAQDLEITTLLLGWLPTEMKFPTGQEECHSIPSAWYSA